MDLIWKVGARAKEILVQKEDPGKGQNVTKTDGASDSPAEAENANVSWPTNAEENRPVKSEDQDTGDVKSEKSSSPEYDVKDENVSRKDSERNLMSGLGSADIKDVSLKAVESAKSIGSFLFGVANRTGRSISETAKHLKHTVEQNSILGDFNKEHEAFVTNKVPKASDVGLPPWIGCEDEENVKQQILSLSADKRNFLRNPPSGVLFEFNFDAMYPVALVMLQEDSSLEKMRFELVPKLVSEENFWRNYFYRVSLLKQSTRLSSMSHQKSSSGDSSTWSSKKSLSDESSKDVKTQLSKVQDVGGDDVGDSPSQEFVSDDFQSTRLSEEDIKHGMKLLGVTDKGSKDDEWTKEIQQELEEYEVVIDESNDDDRAWENEINTMLGDEKVKDIV